MLRRIVLLATVGLLAAVPVHAARVNETTLRDATVQCAGMPTTSTCPDSSSIVGIDGATRLALAFKIQTSTHGAAADTAVIYAVRVVLYPNYDSPDSLGRPWEPTAATPAVLPWRFVPVTSSAAQVAVPKDTLGTAFDTTFVFGAMNQVNCLSTALAMCPTEFKVIMPVAATGYSSRYIVLGPPYMPELFGKYARFFWRRLIGPKVIRETVVLSAMSP